MKKGWEAVIGLEIHAQLSTHSKIFCGCSTRFGDEPNSNTCPVCLGLPGSLPVLNRHAVELGARAALALGLQIKEVSIFARKNYFYPDLPKGYQISQYDRPFSADGLLEIQTAERDEDAVDRATARGARGSVGAHACVFGAPKLTRSASRPRSPMSTVPASAPVTFTRARTPTPSSSTITSEYGVRNPGTGMWTVVSV